ncbi:MULTISPECIES: glycosyltransferase family 39 protein [Ramlibacter]|uniref:Glycosyltransferase family 39 protein n=1 Tax=Ramlibacter pinisoli TaxID=2682844 RepID=A0A6N8IME1_9BURK|nr:MULTISPECIES: glycosyltransferase family 39 protein [Ramlibacter]MBA2960648.1 glycosyltransferase family 39 protein [Ramlibacter sp. CGMCC 1.13660]MVQ27978.1 glycosyltransferase family 39 protein [Ramlibacter pinisoli]
MTPARWRRPAGVPLLLAAFAWLACTAWLRPLALPDEGRYIGVAWEMVRSGDWITPTLNGLPYFHKPPLFYWLTAGALSLAGNVAWAGRIAPWAGACLLVGSAYLFGRRWLGERGAFHWLLVLLTLPLVFVAAQYANLDMLVAGCITACILAFAQAALLEPGAPGRRQALLAGYAFAALGVLAKGLIGIVLPGMVLVVWLVVAGRPLQLLRLLWLPGLLLFLALAAPWFLAMQARFAEFAHYFFVVQHFGRYTTEGFNNARPFWFFPAVLALLGLPWSAWLATRRPAAATEVEPALRRLMWVWLAVIVGFFSLPNSKLVGYVLPAAAPFAFLLAQRWQARRDAPGWPGRLARATAPLAAVLCLAGVVAAAFQVPKSSSPLAAAIAARPPQPVAFVEGYYFDLPFYARLRQPVPVLDRWDDPRTTARDNWRRELADAGAFAPQAVAERLVLPAVLGQPGNCPGGRSWLVGPADLGKRWPLLAAAQPVAASREVALWELRDWAATPAACAGTPRPN